MSSTEILGLLPKLSHEERKKIINRALELNWDEAEREAIEMAEACALQSFQMMDQLEAVDEAKKNAAR